MYYPLVHTLYLRFWEMQLRFQPISGDTFSTPFEYKFTSDDVLNNVDTYFSETNNDYNRSYQYISNSSKDNRENKPGSSFVLLGANFTNNNDKLGSPSSRWNHQYQATFNARESQQIPLRFILGVNTEYGMIVKNGDLAVINI